MRAAIIDIGSGSVRMLLGGKKQTIMTKLGEGLNESGKLSEAGIMRTIVVINQFVAEAKAANAEIYAFATEAVRAALNRMEFTKAVEEQCGITVEVISGCEEAEIAILGACPEGDATVVDIGSASVEIVTSENGELTYVKSLPLGMVRLTEQADSSPDMIRAYAVSGMAKYGEVPICENVIGVGGTFTSLAAMKLGLTAYDPEKVQNTVLERAEVEQLERELIECGSPEEIRKKWTVLPLVRSELITAGAIFVSELMSYFGIEKLTVSECDNLDGYARYKGLNA